MSKSHPDAVSLEEFLDAAEAPPEWAATIAAIADEPDMVRIRPQLVGGCGCAGGGASSAGSGMRVPKSAIRSVRPADAHASGGCGCAGGHHRLVHIDFDPKASVTWAELFERGMAELAEVIKQRAASSPAPTAAAPTPTYTDHETTAALERIMATNAVADLPGANRRAFTMSPEEAAQFGIFPPGANGGFEVGATASARAQAAAGAQGYFSSRSCACIGGQYLCCDWGGFPLGFYCYWLPIKCGPLQPGGGGNRLG